MRVPFSSFDKTVNRPPILFARAAILANPCPIPLAASRLNPPPLSRMLNRTPCFSILSDTVASCARPCRMQLLTASWMTTDQVQGLFNRYGLHGTILDRETHTCGLVLRQRFQHVLQRCWQVLPLEQVQTQSRDKASDLAHDTVQLIDGFIE